MFGSILSCTDTVAVLALLKVNYFINIFYNFWFLKGNRRPKKV